MVYPGPETASRLTVQTAADNFISFLTIYNIPEGKVTNDPDARYIPS